MRQLNQQWPASWRIDMYPYINTYIHMYIYIQYKFTYTCIYIYLYIYINIHIYIYISIHINTYRGEPERSQVQGWWDLDLCPSPQPLPRLRKCHWGHQWNWAWTGNSGELRETPSFVKKCGQDVVNLNLLHSATALVRGGRKGNTGRKWRYFLEVKPCESVVKITERIWLQMRQETVGWSKGQLIQKPQVPWTASSGSSQEGPKRMASPPCLPHWVLVGKHPQQISQAGYRTQWWALGDTRLMPPPVSPPSRWRRWRRLWDKSPAMLSPESSGARARCGRRQRCTA